ncbi:MAG: TIGR04222 domain-containing membrane protein [Planctomycetes bacterium]|nr:TIGR04222 domain-containing membrane protein [Planctomycetota bacterium]
MNPFALPGPEFLVFYIVVAAAAIVGLLVSRRGMGPLAERRNLLADPYGIAYLRAGASEAIRLAAVSLIERGLLLHHGTLVKTPQEQTADSAHHPLERALLKTALANADGESLLKSPGAANALLVISADLEQRGLRQDAASIRQQMIYAGLVGLALVVIGGSKILYALANGHANVEGLVVLTFGATLASAMVLTHPLRTTPRGRGMLADLRLLLESALRRRAAARDDREFLMIGAVFGLKKLNPSTARDWKSLFPAPSKQQGSACGGSSCGSSSCGSGGGCGGGGCGGCGGG